MTKQRIAIIGTGISGLTCGYLLNEKYDITVYEGNDYIGGHTATKQVDYAGESYNVDTGFIVYNDWTYPNFIALMHKLGVSSQPTEMSFSVHSLATGLEYNGNTLNTLFAQRRNLLRPMFWRIIRDILVFNRECKNLDYRDAAIQHKTLQGFIDELGLSNDFSRYYILPMCAAIWSASLEQTRQFPLPFFLRFFNNHGLLNITNRPQWYTLKGGSSSYIGPLTSAYKDKIKLSTAVVSVSKNNEQWAVTDSHEDTTYYDHVIFACHSDQALRLLKAPTREQREVLGAIPYAENDVILHTDTRQLPRRRLAWASWNYCLKETPEENEAPASVTYNMNILQRISAPVTFCVTLNNTAAIDEKQIIGRYRYAHPQYNHEMVAAQSKRHLICGVDNLHFCGAYWYNGFHEDGVRSALDVCSRFGMALC